MYICIFESATHTNYFAHISVCLHKGECECECVNDPNVYELSNIFSDWEGNIYKGPMVELLYRIQQPVTGHRHEIMH